MEEDLGARHRDHADLFLRERLRREDRDVKLRARRDEDGLRATVRLVGDIGRGFGGGRRDLRVAALRIEQLLAGEDDGRRAVLAAEGIDSDRVFEVAGKAGTDPLLPDDPYASSNRRISILLMSEAPVVPLGHKL